MDLRTDLRRPDALPDLGDVELAETHVSLVFLGPREVFKLKKAVDLGFLDFTTVEQRRAACEAEVTLNRRLAPDVYLGVLPVRVDGEGRATLRGEGPVVDWAVHMRRLPDDDSALARLRAGTLTGRDIDVVAETLARFHASARSDAQTATLGAVDAILRNVQENFAQTRAEAVVSIEAAREIEAWQTSLLTRERDVFERRVSEGRVRDGHGDVRLDHVYLAPDGVRVIDCIEFNERFRFADVASDAAFFSMDLARNGHVELAERFLASYARAADDFDLYAVVDFYESYRAYVRAKVALMLASSEGVDDGTRERAEAEARRCLLLSQAAERPSLLAPAVVAVGGLIASGKSTVSSLVGELLSAPVVDADRTRKHLLGRAHTEVVGTDAWAGAYDPAFTERVYEEVLRRAEVVLASGRPVVVDASFRSRAMRAGVAELARRRGVPFRLLECRVDAAECTRRLLARESGPQVSDGRLATFEAFRARFEPITELDDSTHVVLDTALPLEASAARIRQLVATWPRGLVG